MVCIYYSDHYCQWLYNVIDVRKLIILVVSPSKFPKFAGSSLLHVMFCSGFDRLKHHLFQLFHHFIDKVIDRLMMKITLEVLQVQPDKIKTFTSQNFTHQWSQVSIQFISKCHLYQILWTGKLQLTVNDPYQSQQRLDPCSSQTSAITIIITCSDHILYAADYLEIFLLYCLLYLLFLLRVISSNSQGNWLWLRVFLAATLQGWSNKNSVSAICFQFNKHLLWEKNKSLITKTGRWYFVLCPFHSLFHFKMQQRMRVFQTAVSFLMNYGRWGKEEGLWLTATWNQD